MSINYRTVPSKKVELEFNRSGIIEDEIKRIILHFMVKMRINKFLNKKAKELNLTVKEFAKLIEISKGFCCLIL